MNIEELNKKYGELSQRVEQLEFREKLILDNSEVSRIFLEYSVVGFFMPGRRVSSDNSIHTFVNKCSISRILHV